MTGGHHFQQDPSAPGLMCVTCGKKVSLASLQLVFGTCEPKVSDERKQLAQEVIARAGNPQADPFRHMMYANFANWLLGKQPLQDASIPSG